MTATIRKTKNGWIVSNDGFSEHYRAYMQGNITYRVFIPLAIAKASSQPDYLTDLANQVARNRHNSYRMPEEKACRVLSLGRID